MDTVDFTKNIDDCATEKASIAELKSSIDSLHESVEKMQSRIKVQSPMAKCYTSKKPSKHYVANFMSPRFDSDVDLSSTENVMGDVKYIDEISDVVLGNNVKPPLFRYQDSIGTLSNIDLGDVTTADDLSDCEQLSVD